MDVVLFILLGTAIGVFSGFFGIGGGIILTPFLLLLGFPSTLVIGTSLMLSLGASISGAISHFRMKNIQWRYVIVINILGIIGTQIAHPLVLKLESFGYAETAISIFYMILLGFFAFTLLRKRKVDGMKKPSSIHPMVIASLIGLGAGFISSTLGVSGSFFIVPLLISLLGFNTPHAVGTSLASVFFIISTGLITYSLSSPLNYLIGISLIIGTFIGSPIGAKATTLLKESSMRKLLGILYVCMIISVITKIFSLSFIGLMIIGLFTAVFFTILVRKKLQLKKQRAPET
ncbi:sulfite exporter TauE/SafE family protein [bacterium LRH843]|nr:sulfite exporter TauE/SafE family protein [bacterium LRH843]